MGYALDHAGDVYRMYNPATNQAHVTRDVIWLKRMYYEKMPIALEMVLGPQFILSPNGHGVIRAGESMESEPVDTTPEPTFTKPPET